MRLWIFLLIAAISPSVLAAFSNYNSILIGDQVAGMGGAGTAVLGDVAAGPFYNPATLGMLDASAFSAAVGVYKKYDTLYGREEHFTDAPMRVNQGFFRSLPSSTGSAIKIKDWVMALSIIVPDYDNFKGDLYNNGNSVTTLSYVDESLWSGLSISKMVTNYESMGVTIYYTARNYTRSLSDRSFSGDTAATLFSSERTKTDNTILAVLGYYNQWSSYWGFGFSVRPRSFQIASKVSVYESTTYVDTSVPILNTLIVNKPDQDGEVVIPGRMSMGLSFNPDETLVIAGDVSYHEGLNYEETGLSSISLNVNHSPTWNFQLGAEKALIKWLKLRAGVYTDFSSHPDPASVSRIQPDHVDMYGFSANFVFIAGNKIGYTFGGYYTGGKGISRQRVNQDYETMAKSQHIFTMLLGTSFFF